MIVKIEAKPERALREALTSVARAQVDRIPPSIAALDERERAEALSLAMVIAGYVAVEVSASQWPVQSSIHAIAEDLATTGSLAKQLSLDTGEIYAYLSRTVLGPEPLEDVISDELRFTVLPIIVALQSLTVYSPEGMSAWEYLDRIERAVEIAGSLDESVRPATVMLAYMPETKAADQT